MPNLDYKSAHRFVKDQRRAGNAVRWEGWDMVFWKPTRHGFTNVNGAFDRDKGRWGVESRVAVNSDGIWKVPNKNVKSS